VAITKSDEKDIICLPNQRHIGNFLSASHLHKRSEAPSLVPAIRSTNRDNYYRNKANNNCSIPNSNPNKQNANLSNEVTNNTTII